MQDETMQEPKPDARAAEPTFSKTPKRAAMSGWLGGALEYYDFFIYAQAAALVFPTLFFPKGDATVAIIASLATFGVGYVARPIGAVVLGHLSDTMGRKRILLICMLVIGLSTTAIAFLPAYAAIGWLAPALLTLLRLIQGFAVGGEIAGASTMVVEHAPFGRRGFFGSFALQGVQAGQLIAAAIFLPLAAAMPQDAFHSWGWRIPFLLSLVVLLVGYLIRRGVEETPVFREEVAEGEVVRSPLKAAFKENGVNILRVFLMSNINVVPVTVTVFGATYATSAAYGNGFSATNFLWITVITNIVSLIFVPVFGAMSDRIGRRITCGTGIFGSAVLSIPFLYFISVGNEIMAMVFAVLMAGVLYSSHNSAYAAFYQELFTARTRVSGFALPFNVGTALGAFMPTIFAVLAPPGTNVPVIVGAMIVGIGVLAAAAAFSAKETSRIPMSELGKKDARPLSPAEYKRARSDDAGAATMTSSTSQQAPDGRAR
ncbi:MFS transporter [Saccharopolyspora hattusasensis]|uniref:MFS transporter n=1 Tax=Saccharopolyspora hattusasensis TaxID=1128679 RepID=UPI003D977DB9